MDRQPAIADKVDAKDVRGQATQHAQTEVNELRGQSGSSIVRGISQQGGELQMTDAYAQIGKMSNQTGFPGKSDENPVLPSHGTEAKGAKADASEQKPPAEASGAAPVSQHQKDSPVSPSKPGRDDATPSAQAPADGASPPTATPHSDRDVHHQHLPLPDAGSTRPSASYPHAAGHVHTGSAPHHHRERCAAN